MHAEGADQIVDGAHEAFFGRAGKLPRHGCYAISVLQVWRATNVVTAKCLNRPFVDNLR